VRRIHAVASPADRLLIGPKVSVILPRAVYWRLSRAAAVLRVTVEELLRPAVDCLAARPSQLVYLAAIGS